MDCRIGETHPGEALRDAKVAGVLGEFVGTTKESNNIPSGLPDGTTDNGDGTFTLPTGEIVEPE